jgi:hypothetical protein
VRHAPNRHGRALHPSRFSRTIRPRRDLSRILIRRLPTATLASCLHRRTSRNLNRNRNQSRCVRRLRPYAQADDIFSIGDHALSLPIPSLSAHGLNLKLASGSSDASLDKKRVRGHREDEASGSASTSHSKHKRVMGMFSKRRECCAFARPFRTVLRAQHLYHVPVNPTLAPIRRNSKRRSKCRLIRPLLGLPMFRLRILPLRSCPKPFCTSANNMVYSYN